VENLNFPQYDFSIQMNEQKKLIFDIIRKKFIPLTPEEWVRQHCIHHLMLYYKLPLGLISIERKITFNKLTKRFDIVVFNKSGNPFILVECKAPSVALTSEVVLQAGVYNSQLDTSHIWLTNGIKHLWLTKTENLFEFKTLPEIGSLR
jgi:hypothetical protein